MTNHTCTHSISLAITVLSCVYCTLSNSLSTMHFFSSTIAAQTTLLVCFLHKKYMLIIFIIVSYHVQTIIK